MRFTTRGCNDDSTFIDSRNFTCAAWVGFDCSSAAGYTQAELDEVMANCKDSCDLCETDARAGFVARFASDTQGASALLSPSYDSTDWCADNGLSASGIPASDACCTCRCPCVSFMYHVGVLTCPCEVILYVPLDVPCIYPYMCQSGGY